MEKAKRFGIDTYNAEQAEKAKILEIFLLGYNDGRQKTLFCVAVNLLELQDLQAIIREIERKPDMETDAQRKKLPLLLDYAGCSVQRKISI